MNKKIMLGAGITVAGTAVMAAATNVMSGWLMGLAMDRQASENMEKYMCRVSGRLGLEAMEEQLDSAAKELRDRKLESVEIVADDGCKLVGHLSGCDNPERILIAVHGWRSSWSRDFGIIADFWRKNRCIVLYIEQRAQGESGGAYIGFGMLEKVDCKKWIEWVIGRYPQPIPIYLAGLSMGASTVLMTGGLTLPKRVHGIMADCGFTSPHAIWKHVAQKNLHLHYGLYAKAVEYFCKKKINCNPRVYSTTESLKMCKVPVLLVHGTADRFVPVEMTYENYLACSAPKHLLVVPGAEHGMSYLKDREGYEDAMQSFWKRYDGVGS